VGRLGRWAGTTAVAEAPGSFETEQGCGTSTVSREGHLLIIRDPIDPHRADRWDRGFVTKEALCRTDPDLWGAGVGNHPGLPGPDYTPGPMLSHGARPKTGNRKPDLTPRSLSVEDPPSSVPKDVTQQNERPGGAEHHRGRLGDGAGTRDADYQRACII